MPTESQYDEYASRVLTPFATDGNHFGHIARGVSDRRTKRTWPTCIGVRHRSSLPLPEVDSKYWATKSLVMRGTEAQLLLFLGRDIIETKVTSLV